MNHLRSSSIKSRKGFLSFLVLSFILLTVLSFPARSTGADEVQLRVVSESLKVTPPGSLVGVFRVTNKGPQGEFKLRAEFPSGWIPLGYPQRVTLGSGTSRNVFIPMKVPVGTPAGSYEVPLKVVSAAEPSNRDRASLKVEVESTTGVELIPPDEKSALPGKRVKYRFRVKNTGNSPAKFEATARSKWPTEVPSRSFKLFAGEKTEVVVVHRVPEGAVAPQKGSLTVSVQAPLQREVRDQSTVNTTVLPSPPEEITKKLGLVTDADFGLSSKIRPEGITSSKLTFEGSGQALGTTLNFSGTLSGFDEESSLSELLSNYHISSRSSHHLLQFGDVKEDGEKISHFLSFSSRGTALSLSPSDSIGVSAFDLRGKQAAVLSLSKEITGLNLAWYKDTSGDSAKDVFLASLNSSLPGYSSFGLEYGGQMEGGQAAYLSSRWELSNLTSRADLTWISAPFLRRSHSRFGIDTSHFMDGGPFSLNGSYSYSRRWKEGTAEKGLKTSRFQLGGRGTTSDLQAGLEFSLKHKEGTLGEDSYKKLTQKISGDLGFDLSGANLSLSASVERTKDRISGNNRSQTDLEASFEPEVSPSPKFWVKWRESHALGTAGEKHTRTKGGLELEGGRTYPPFALTFTRRKDSPLKITAESNFRFGESTLDLSLTADTGSGISLGFTYKGSFPLTLPFWKVKSQLGGYVFVDEDLDGRRDPGEQGIGEALLSYDNRRAVTEEDGRFLFPPVHKGRYLLQVLELPGNYVTLNKVPTYLRSEPGDRSQFNLPVAEAATLKVKVVKGNGSEKEADGSSFYLSGDSLNGFQAGEEKPGIGGVKIELIKGEQVYNRRTDQWGSFRLNRLAPGTWTLKVDKATLPENYYLEDGPIKFELEPGEKEELLIKARPEQREIEWLDNG